MVQCTHLAREPSPALSSSLAMLHRSLGTGHSITLRPAIYRVEVHQVSIEFYHVTGDQLLTSQTQEQTNCGRKLR